MPLPRRSVLTLGAAVPLAAGLGTPAAAATGTGGQAGSSAGAPAERGGPLANLAHLEFLGDTVSPRLIPGHDTYRLREEPALGALWTYADRGPDGTYRRIGGGTLDPDTGHYEQGAYNADDMARAAVVHLRHHALTGAGRGARSARELLRGLCYLQTTRGEHAGNVVLWQQADGTLNRSALPPETPDPSDSGPSYWLARFLWALGEGYAFFRHAEPPFAAFLRARLELALDALERDVLSRYGTWETADGRRVPGWLITHGADASSEAVLGLTAYVRAGGGRRARRAEARLAEGIAALGSGSAGRWPYGAMLPTATSVSQWHAWGAQMPTAVAEAADALERPRLLDAALDDAAGFTPELLTAGGCDNGWLPAPTDRNQIAYGVDSRLQSLLTVAEHARRPGLYPLAALTAAWYFGANRAGEAVYDPETGVTFDGVGPDGKINRNSGAESTIHGQLSMLALDALAQRGVRLAPSGLDRVAEHDGLRVLEAEEAEPSGSAEVVRPDSPWTGESQYSGDAYVRLPEGGGLSWRLPEGKLPLLVSPVVDLVGRPQAGTTVWSAGSERLGRIDHGAGGPQGISAAPGALTPVPLPAAVRAGGRLRARAEGVEKGTLRVDALLVRPVVSRLVLSGPERSLALLHNADERAHTVEVSLPGEGPVAADLYDDRARPAGHHTDSGGPTRVTVPARGFAILRRG
ncbi:hypothetical protein GCM10012287_44060 [Streptomyces daqingensis]|uniref:Uncharacterized protein n=1 Tax=Streptomyces daqingensis TaxID=1472640 RepID=A0ABQ2MLQ2_9ACTN|nr:hypothetical protein [Streptomyces daqingensis]GGO54641.1 hypothetical protein GCM10012287_44060 [Streptomyces daqingensis]